MKRALDYHNDKYKTHIVIKGKATDVYPNLRGQSNWDWVCCDEKTSDEIAVEVKRLTDPELEELGNIIWQILIKVKGILSNELPGIFYLHVNAPKNYVLPLKQENVKELTDVLRDVIYNASQKLHLNSKKDLKPKINKKLSFSLPNGFRCILHKIDNKGSMLTFDSGQTGWKPPEFTESELEKFEELVSTANEQLKKADVQETFLVFIEEGYRPINARDITKALESLKPASYSDIKYVYLVSGEQVAEIFLPNH